MLLLLNTDRPEYTELDIYLKFDQLDNGDVVELLSGLDRLYNDIIGRPFNYYYQRRPFFDYFYPFKNILEVQSINTGQSIRFRFKEGWKPNIRIKKGELKIDVPRKLGIPILVLYFLLAGVQKVAELRNDILDNELKQLEIQMKKMEIYREIEDQRNSDDKDEDFVRLQRQADKTIEFLYYNNSINHVEINGLTIKSEEKK
ncbi:MAG: hypothetical protein HRU69_14065 [Flammeovirgaceae bacterium]|nr:MAG: hypothetical protein HRU69_14065 [Flammeovirgaceae bacterium]